MTPLWHKNATAFIDYLDEGFGHKIRKFPLKWIRIRVVFSIA
jgi:hypothetical protein